MKAFGVEVEELVLSSTYDITAIFSYQSHETMRNSFFCMQLRGSEGMK